MSRRTILVFEHMRAQNPGIFRDYAPDHGIEFHEIDLHAGDKIPNLENYDALWAMGGSMNIWEEDEFPWLVEEKLAIRRAVFDLKMPFLGICFGHQLLGEVAGGVVGPTEHCEIGLVDVLATAAGQSHPMLNSLSDPTRWANVHLAEVMKPPPGAEILAASAHCQNHMMQVGDLAYSCQFHPEVCDHTVKNWLKIPGTQEKLESKLGKAGLAKFKSEISECLEKHNEAAGILFANWIKLVFK